MNDQSHVSDCIPCELCPDCHCSVTNLRGHAPYCPGETQKRWLELSILAKAKKVASAIAGTQNVEKVIQCWQEPHRKFHTLEHLVSVLERVGTSQLSMVLAALYHDAIYTPGAQDNEAKSAALLLADAQDAPEAVEAARLIKAYAFNRKQDPDEEKFFCADCGVLLGNGEALERYERQIQAEFGPYCTPEQYRIGRSDFLKKAAEVFPENKDRLLALATRVEKFGSVPISQS